MKIATPESQFLDLILKPINLILKYDIDCHSLQIDASIWSDEIGFWVQRLIGQTMTRPTSVHDKDNKTN